MRSDGRQPDQLRDMRFTRAFTEQPAGSVLAQSGKTLVLCTACVEDGVPPFLMNTNNGWLTAEYGMQPGSTNTRKAREGRRSSPDARSLEIGRLVGRALRSVCVLSKLPGRTIWLDCDVLQADGGTRTTAISGAMVALYDACKHMEEQGWLRGWPLRSHVAAVSVGVLKGEVLLDLNYHEDSRAEVDLNVVMTSDGEFVELQGGAERTTFSQATLSEMLGTAHGGIQQIQQLQNETLGIAS